MRLPRRSDLHPAVRLVIEIIIIRIKQSRVPCGSMMRSARACCSGMLLGPAAAARNPITRAPLVRSRFILGFLERWNTGLSGPNDVQGQFVEGRNENQKISDISVDPMPSTGYVAS